MKKVIFCLGIVFLFSGCGKDYTEPPKTPTSATLVFPYENYLCHEGSNITPTESTVLFEWKAGEYTEKYELVLRNMSTGITTSYSTNDLSIAIVIARNTAFKWYIISKSNSLPDTAQSPVWKFYNSGADVESYIPFPAEIISPAMAAIITAPSNVITLDWTGSDVDNDIVGYDVYFGKSAIPPIHLADHKESILENIPVQSNTIYYWKVITKDSKGNSSDSGVFQFKIL
jgi:hypothetical protein